MKQFQNFRSNHCFHSFTLLTLTICFLLGAGNKAHAEVVESIKIESKLFVFSSKSEACDYTITRDDDEYKTHLMILDVIKNKMDLDPRQHENYQELLYSRKTKVNAPPTHIAKEKIDHFAESLEALTVEKLDLNQIGIRKDLLVKFAHEHLNNILEPFSGQNIPDIEYLSNRHLERWTDVPLTLRRLATYFEGKWRHDHPNIKVEIVFDTGRVTKLSSSAQHIFMVPWKIQRNGIEYTTYDMEISRALGNILHPQCANHKRIVPDIGSFLIHALWPVVRDNFYLEDSLKTSVLLGNQVSAIKKNFNIEASYLRTGKDSESDGRWHALLNHKSWPRNLVINYKTQWEIKSLDLTKFSPDKLKQYGDKALSVPWLKRFIEENPFYRFAVGFNNGNSISEREYKKILNYFKKQPNIDTTSLDYTYNNEIVFLKVLDEERRISTWLLFPDKTMSLVGFLGERILKWESKKERDYNTYIAFQCCFGTRISLEGNILNPSSNDPIE